MNLNFCNVENFKCKTDFKNESSREDFTVFALFLCYIEKIEIVFSFKVKMNTGAYFPFQK